MGGGGARRVPRGAICGSGVRREAGQGFETPSAALDECSAGAANRVHPNGSVDYGVLRTIKSTREWTLGVRLSQPWEALSDWALDHGDGAKPTQAGRLSRVDE